MIKYFYSKDSVCNEELKEKITQRNTPTNSIMRDSVYTIMQDVKQRGNIAVTEYTNKFDGVFREDFKLTKSELEAQAEKTSPALKEAISNAKKNIEKFHRSQLHHEPIIETTKGVFCQRRSIPIDSIGLYIPAGTAPLFSTMLMLGVPATIAGCKKIVVTTPPQKDGTIHPAMAYVALTLGLNDIFLIGGVQAIASMTYGTETVPKVKKVFGPGNQYVTVAKQIAVENKVAIDLPAGPSEVAILADETSNPVYIAADLISQAEHGEDSIVILVTTSDELIEKVKSELELQLATLPRSEIAKAALKTSKAVVTDSIESGMEIINTFAPEHLIICTKNPKEHADLVINAGSVFIGSFSAESFGDYASGTNHVLPTDGYAFNYSGVSVDSFLRKVTFQEITRDGLFNLGNSVIEMAQAEKLEGHALAISKRMENEKNEL